MGKIGILWLIMLFFVTSCATSPDPSVIISPQNSSDNSLVTNSEIPISTPEATSSTFIDLPMPSSSIWGLTDIDAVLYDSAVEWYSNRGGLSHLLMPSLALVGEYTNETGDTCYVCLFKQCDYYNLAYGLSNKDYPQYTLSAGTIPARFTISATSDGNLICVDIFVLQDGLAANWSIDEICGPLTDLAEKLKNAEDVEIVRQITPDDPVELLQNYIDFFFS